MRIAFFVLTPPQVKALTIHYSNGSAHISNCLPFPAEPPKLLVIRRQTTGTKAAVEDLLVSPANLCLCCMAARQVMRPCGLNAANRMPRNHAANLPASETYAMPRLVDLVRPSCDTAGIYWHKPSKRFICHIGYHKIFVTDENGFTAEKRIQSTQYLGTKGDEQECVAKLNALRDLWQQAVDEQRCLYDAEQGRRRLLGLSRLNRFKPCWPSENAPQTPQPVAVHASEAPPTANGRELLDMTVAEAKERYLIL
jgi:hypothetical protein